MYLFKIWDGEGSHYLGFDAFVPFAFSKSIHTKLYVNLLKEKDQNLFLYLRLSFDWEQFKLVFVL